MINNHHYFISAVGMICTVETVLPKTGKYNVKATEQKYLDSPGKKPDAHMLD